MMLGLRYRYVLWALLTLLPSLLFAQENTLRIVFEGDSSLNSSVGTFRRQDVVYASLTDIAQVFSLGSFENPSARKFELKLPSYRIMLSGGNPFLVVTDTSKQRTTYQLPWAVIYAANAFFVPLASFLPLFDSMLDANLILDGNATTLRVTTAPAMPTYDFTTVFMESKVNGMLLRIPAARPLEDFESWLHNEGWLYVTIADAKADVDAINRLKAAGLIKQIVAVQSPTSVQLTFRLSGKIANTEISRDEHSNDILISIRTPSDREKELLEKRQHEIQSGLENQRKRWELDVIVIDPGHGGYDPGTVGVTGVKEKDVTLAIALKVGRLIEKNLKGVKVVYTRKTDTFVPVYKRGQIANEADGKLFVSIHANSTKHKPTPLRGFEVYLLRPGRTEEAITIAERENSVIQLEEGYEQRYKQLTDENFILVTMAQSAHVKASELFADIAQQELESHVNVPNQGVKQAGFYVLVGASMPNVLVETAYLSNREDERFLRSNAGQQRIAAALFAAVKRYKQEYEKLLLEGKEIGENR
jgi:N-acetylmuramoyl-L-alanine amidase